MSRTFKDIKKEYLSPAEQLERNHYSVCKKCEWCKPEMNYVRSNARKEAIAFELQLVDLEENSELLQQAINKFRNN
jgi:hypothetical protein